MWQTGSGTQTNMNANEVIANRAIELAGGALGSKQPVHPNDDVNRCAVVERRVPDRDARRGGASAVGARLLPALRRAARRARRARRAAFADVVKIGRTHLMDATPLTLGQEISGWAAQLAAAQRARRGGAARRCTSSRSAARRSAPASTRRPASATRAPREHRAS